MRNISPGSASMPLPNALRSFCNALKAGDRGGYVGSEVGLPSVPWGEAEAAPASGASAWKFPKQEGSSDSSQSVKDVHHGNSHCEKRPIQLSTLPIRCRGNRVGAGTLKEDDTRQLIRGRRGWRLPTFLAASTGVLKQARGEAARGPKVASSAVLGVKLKTHQRSTGGDIRLSSRAADSAPRPCRSVTRGW